MDIYRIAVNSFSKKMNQNAIGLKYSIENTYCDYENISEFASVIGDNYFNLIGGKIIVPPFFLAAIVYPAVKKLMFSSLLKANLLRLVHAEQSISVYRLIEVNEKINLENKIESINAVSAGELVNISTKVYSSSENKPLIESHTSFLIRGKKPPSKNRSSEDIAVFTSEFQIKVPFDKAKKYAAVSGDKNPIHINRFFAKIAGLPGTILHGMCTLGMVNSVLVRERCAGNYMRYSGISGRFTKYVRPGDILTIKISEKENDIYDFIVQNSSGEIVIKNGKFKVKP